MGDDSLLAIYLNDHLAGATAGVELARRARGANRDTEFGPFLERLATEIEEDRESLLAIMRRLDIGQDRVKQLVGWSAEKLGRLKLNGSLLSYSPLSRVVELEGLSVAVAGKLSGWRALERLGPTEPRLSAAELTELIDRAERQRDELEEHRLRAVELALGGEAQPATSER